MRRATLPGAPRGTRRGVAAVEFALMAPVLLTLLVAMVEAVSYVRAWYRLEQAAGSAAEAGARTQRLDKATVEGVFAAARAVAEPYAAWNTGTSGSRARTVVNGISNTGSGNVVAWACSRGDATLAPNVAGAAPAPAVTLPAGFVVPRGQTVILVEIISVRPPFMRAATEYFLRATGSLQMHAYAIVRPRVTELDSVSGGCPA